MDIAQNQGMLVFAGILTANSPDLTQALRWFWHRLIV
jgi:hypothetical protein